MAAYLHPTTETFAKRVSSPYFVDKSRLLIKLNACVGRVNRKYVCISRPRGFGKTVTAQMLCAYYDKGVNNSSLFDKLHVGAEGSQLKVENNEGTTATTETEAEDIYHKHLNRYDVIFINMAAEYSSAGNSVANLKEQLEQKIGAELKEHFPGVIGDESPKLWDMLCDVYSQYRQQYREEHKSVDGSKAWLMVPGQFVFIIDDYDCVMRNPEASREEMSNYLDFLTALLKDRDYVALAFMTGILPIKKLGTHSGLIMFDERTIFEPGPFASYWGFTADEVKTLCEVHSCSFEELGKWYGGYTLGKGGHIFNPLSVLQALETKNCAGYWTELTESKKALATFLTLDVKDLRESLVRLISGGEEEISALTFNNDLVSLKTRDDVLTLLVHLGYLSVTRIPSYFHSAHYKVRVPNLEINSAFKEAIETIGQYSGVARTINKSEALLETLLKGDESTVAQVVTRAHEQCCSLLTYNDENSLSCVLSLAFYSARDNYTVIRELPTGKGFADLVFIPKPGADAPALLIELKYDHSTESALTQIKSQHYPQALEAYRGNLILAGISYDKDTKEHHCVIERV